MTMSLSLVISLLSIFYLKTLLSISIITNVYPYLPDAAMESVKVMAANVTIRGTLDEGEGLMLGVLINQSVIFIIGEHTEDCLEFMIFFFFRRPWKLSNHIGNPIRKTKIWIAVLDSPT